MQSDQAHVIFSYAEAYFYPFIHYSFINIIIIINISMSGNGCCEHGVELLRKDTKRNNSKIEKPIVFVSVTSLVSH